MPRRTPFSSKAGPGGRPFRCGVWWTNYFAAGWGTRLDLLGDLAFEHGDFEEAHYRWCD